MKQEQIIEKTRQTDHAMGMLEKWDTEWVRKSLKELHAFLLELN